MKSDSTYKSLMKSQFQYGVCIGLIIGTLIAFAIVAGAYYLIN